MKAEHILLLVLAGALGGAGLMKVMQKPKPAVTPVVRAEAHVPPAPVSLPPSEPVPAPPPVVQQPAPVEAPAPITVRAHVSRPPRRAPYHPVYVAKPSPFTPPQVIAKVAPPPVVVEPPKPVASAVVEPPSPPPTPPARVEPEHVTVTPAPPSPPPTVTLPAGLLIPVRLVDGLSSERNAPGDTFVATLDHELVADGFVIAERGARAEGRVVSSSRGTRTQGGAALSLELTRISTSDGQRVGIRTDSFDKRMEPDHRQDAEKVAAGAIIGAAIGAIAGGGKGAAVGAGVGGGAGAGDVLLTRRAADIPSETRISFRLNAPVTLTEQR
jgi:hypothetical protein